jgi:hypothetical protein
MQSVVNTESGCTASPFTQTFWATATVGGNIYIAYAATVTFYPSTGTLTMSYVFPDLIVTMLTPGELITAVRSYIIWYCAVYLVELILQESA